MTVTQAIDHRRSVKHFDPSHQMPDSDLVELLRLARLAPSSFNLQNYRFVVIRDEVLRRQVRAVAWDQAQVTDASALILLCADLRAHEKEPARYWAHAPQPVQDFLVPAIGQFYGGKPQLIRDEAMRSIGLAGMTLMLAAIGLGYESCPMIGFDADAVAKLVGLPDDHAIGFLVAIGKPVQAPWPRGERLPDAESVINNRFA